MRIVSLVPSLTEALFGFGLGGELVGRTRYCEEPAGEVDSVEAVGGTKNPDVERILELGPDLVIVNREENRLEDYHLLREAGVPVHVTHPTTVLEAAGMLGELGEVCGAPVAGLALAEQVRAAHQEVRTAEDESSDGPRVVRTFCPIWRNPWMTFRKRTYIGDVLATAGCLNVFGEGADGGADDGHCRNSSDFFEVGLAGVAVRSPQLLLLPDEPYVFRPEHGDELRAAGMPGAAAVCVDGKDLSWYGPRLPDALRRLSALVGEISAESAG